MDSINPFQTERKVIASQMKITQENLEHCGERIRNGKLVAFPTETVYGLGADATNEKAVLSIFEAKGRPLTDPVIVHIADHHMIDKVLLDRPERDLIHFLGEKLWPGPLTLIGPCNTEFIPALVGSNTGTIGVRWPRNEIAQKLILAAERPIAAPSANRFMHVSPSRSEHVFFDLYDKDVAILQGKQTEFGVESTVVFVGSHPDGSLFLKLLRPGTLELKDIYAALSSSAIYRNLDVQVKKNTVSIQEDQNSVAPGQLLKHYCPNVECSMIIKDEEFVGKQVNLKLEEVALIDFGAEFWEMKTHIGHYVDLSSKGCYQEALSNLYLLLRECEVVQGISQILIAYQTGGYNEGTFGSTLFDKVYRSAGGTQLKWKPGSLTFCGPQ